MTRVIDFDTTRTTPLSDDYLGIDSTTGGTANMLFSDAAAAMRAIEEGTATPAANADFVGQDFVKTNATVGVWKAVQTGAGASDWIKLHTSVDDIADGALSGLKLTDASVNAGDKITDGTVTNAKLATGIDGAKLTAASVPTSALVDTPLTNPLAANLNANNKEIQNAKLVKATALAATATISSGVLTIPFDGWHTVTVNQNITSFTFSNYPAAGEGRTVIVELVVNGTGGYTISGWDSKIKWLNNDTAPVLTTTANKMDVLSFYTIDGGTSKIRGCVLGQNSTP